MAKIILTRDELEKGVLPGLCMRCGQPAALVINKRFSWGPGWVMLLFVAGAVCIGPLFWVALILIPIFLRQMRVPVPLCENHRNHWLPLQIIAFGGIGILAILVFSMAVMVAIASHRATPGVPDPLVRTLAGAILWLFGATVVFLVIIAFPAAIMQTRVVRATLIEGQGATLTEGQVIHLSGVASQFADQLEERRDQMRRHKGGVSSRFADKIQNRRGKGFSPKPADDF
jgi:hypothetical protein